MSLRLNQWIFAALLVISQTVLLIHEADVDHLNEADHCLVCLVGSGHDDAASVDVHAHGVFMAARVAPVAVSARPVSSRLISRRSRAPPLNPLHV